jgi:hypothetical protein
MSATVELVRLVERDATTLEISDVASYLQDQIGQKMTAYLAGVTDAKMVGRWASTEHAPRDDVKLRLRHGYQAVRLLVEAYSAETAKAWLFGANTRLDDEAPAYILRHARGYDDLRFVVPAARAFAEGRA